MTLYDRALGPGEIRAAMDPAPVSVPAVGPLGLGLLGLAILGLGAGALRARAASR